MVKQHALRYCVLFILYCSSANAAVPETGPTATRNPITAHPKGVEQVYSAEFFAAYRPQTALDMLARAPGFAIDEGEDVRGFGGAAGNVLIDGQRPTVKSGGIYAVLRRIAARQVEHIELLRGGGNAAEAPGQSIVANVVLKVGAGGSGNASLEISRNSEGDVSPSASLTYAKSIGKWRASLDLEAGYSVSRGSAHYRQRGAASLLTTLLGETSRSSKPEVSIAGSAARSLAGGTLTLNGRFEASNDTSSQRQVERSGNLDTPIVGTRYIGSSTQTLSGELGGDWTRPLGDGWETKLIGLGRWTRSYERQNFETASYRSRADQHSMPIETVARITLLRSGDHRLRPEVGLEVANNWLASRLTYNEEPGANMIPVILPGANTGVSELRGEAFGNLTLALGGGFSAEAGIASEISKISVSGNASISQRLSYFKPSVALAWQVFDHTQLRVAVRRSVDQLDFSNFAASVDFNDNRVFGGNAKLKPAQITSATLRLDQRWGSIGSLVMEGFHYWTKGHLGYTLLDSGEEAFGSVGNSRLWGVTAQATMPLGSVLRGAQITVDGALRGSALRSTITGRNEPLSEVTTRHFSAEFRHDLSDIQSSWGLSYSAPEELVSYYAAEEAILRTAAVWSLWAETNAFSEIKATLSLSAIGGERSRQLRNFYERRRGGIFKGSEEKSSYSSAAISLNLSRAL